MSALPFGKKNYIWMLVGLAIIVVGFGLMASGKPPHGFDFVGLTLSPIVVVAGFVVELFAILSSDNNKV